MHALPTKHISLFLYQFEKVVLPSFDVRAFALSYCVLFSCIWLFGCLELFWSPAHIFFWKGKGGRGISEEGEVGMVLGWVGGGETVVSMYCTREESILKKEKEKYFAYNFK